MRYQWLWGQSCSLHTGHALSLSPVAAERESTAPRLWLGVTQPRPSPASSLLRPEVSAKILGATPPASLPLSLHHRSRRLASSASSRVKHSPPSSSPRTPRSRHSYLEHQDHVSEPQPPAEPRPLCRQRPHPHRSAAPGHALFASKAARCSHAQWAPARPWRSVAAPLELFWRVHRFLLWISDVSCAYFCTKWLLHEGASPTRLAAPGWRQQPHLCPSATPGISTVLVQSECLLCRGREEEREGGREKGTWTLSLGWSIASSANWGLPTAWPRWFR